MARLKYLSSATIDGLRATISQNVALYLEGSFSELMRDGEWSVELALDVDLAPLADLDPEPSAVAEVQNSRLVWRTLGQLKPSLAYEEGIWVRLTHVECLEYSRSRWLAGVTDPAEMEKQVALHFFARTLNGRRDDNAISRLWYNAYIAYQIIPDPALPALEVMLRRADSRLTFLERSLTGSRARLAAGVVRVGLSQPWINATEGNFREFFKVLNRRGGGRVFEAMSDEKIDMFMLDCAFRAGMPAV
ncbi:MAG: DUF6339 family protein [Acetobacteraceae bacterium]